MWLAVRLRSYTPMHHTMPMPMLPCHSSALVLARVGLARVGLAENTTKTHCGDSIPLLQLSFRVMRIAKYQSHNVSPRPSYYATPLRECGLFGADVSLGASSDTAGPGGGLFCCGNWAHVATHVQLLPPHNTSSR